MPPISLPTSRSLISSGVPIATSVPEVLGRLAAALSAAGHRWYLFGAQAAILWGRPRTSLDIDVTVEAPAEGAAKLLERFAEWGFELRIRSGVEEFVRRTRVLPVVDAASGIPVDIVLAGPGIEELFLDRVVRVQIGNAEIPVISPEDLIVTKILAGRAKDLEDVRGVVSERRSSLDLASVRETLRILEEGLGQSDLLPLFEGLLLERR